MALIGENGENGENSLMLGEYSYEVARLLFKSGEWDGKLGHLKVAKTMNSAKMAKVYQNCRKKLNKLIV